MKDECEPCRYELLYTAQYKNLTDDMSELKERVSGLEATLARGVLLLVANLVGVVVTLVRELLV